MKLKIKRFLLLLSLVVSVMILITIIPLINNHLSRYEILDSLILNYESIILVSIILHFLIGFLIINKIKLLESLSNKYIVLFFFVFYILFKTIVKLNNATYEFEFYLLEISLIVGLSLGLIFRKYKKKYSLLVSLGFIIGFLFFTYKVTIPLASQFRVYGNYLGRTSNSKVEGVNLLDSNGSNFYLETKDSKIIVIDFWNNNCGICFRKFPLLKEIQREYKNDINVKVIAVNVFLDNEEIKKAKELLYETNNSDITSYYMSKNDAKGFNVKWYPKVVVIKNNEIIFEGHIETLNLFKFLYLE